MPPFMSINCEPQDRAGGQSLVALALSATSASMSTTVVPGDVDAGETPESLLPCTSCRQQCTGYQAQRGTTVIAQRFPLSMAAPCCLPSLPPPPPHVPHWLGAGTGRRSLPATG